MKLKISIIAILYLANINFVWGQMEYLGLKEEANVREAQNQLLTEFGTYWPESQIIDNYLYIPTINGIYRKNLSTTNDTIWDLYAFEGVPIRDFIKNNDTILAVTAIYADSNLLLLSTNDGLSYIDYTPTSFFNINSEITILKIAQNPQNPNNIAVMHTGLGVYLSSDFGQNWTLSNFFIGGYQDWFLGFNPNDTSNIFYTGEQLFYRSYIFATYNNGNSWIKVDSFQTHCTHGVAFHPTNKDIMVSYGEGRLAKSINQGQNWGDVGAIPLYIYKVIFDPVNPNILYASGDFHGVNDTITIYRSTDMGDNWQVFYKEKIANSDGVMNIHLFNGKLIVFTLVNGAFLLDIGNVTSIKEALATNELLIYPNPAESFIRISCNEIISKANILDINSRILIEKEGFTKDAIIDLKDLNNGVYILKVETSNGILTRKIVKQ